MKKRGQYYLVAAIVIIAILVGFITISNYSQVSSMKIYDVGKELEIEGGKVLDYGAYNNFDTTDTIDLLEKFIEDYAQYREVDELYLIFGDTGEIIVTGYQEAIKEAIIVNVGGGDLPMSFISQTPSSNTFSPSGNKVTITSNNYDYEFDLGVGKNLYFIMIKTIGGEEHVYVSD